ncbi:hypothetical protein TSUD_406260 [Trifolium subterraneum]|uniref:DUF4218 domain-containing protein n=1 Tax=Trifolium subterraneum TaxID=3900 RepID=A0A2Z6P2N4_TRISU|nr:hypothetical protein TSUD_406260 [Trifolium subterraneum]
MDRSWMYDRVNPNRFGLKDSFLSGVAEFVNKAMEQPQYLNNGEIRCPCVNCKCIDLKTASEDQDVDIGGHSSSGEDVGDEDQFEAMNEMIYDAYRPFSNVPNAESDMENETHGETDVPIEKAQQFYNKLISTNQPIYEGASESKLSISVKLLAAMSIWHVPQKCIDHFAQMLVDVCPTKQCLPQNHYQATKLVSTLGLEVQKIDCCVNGCLLYYKEDISLTECRVCQAPRYVPRRKGMGNHKDVPEKRMFYFPIIPRLQRLHNLDVMHIEKNFFDNVFNTVMNVTGKTKDNEKARDDLANLCVCGDLEMQPLPNGKFAKPKAKYSFTSEEAKLVCQWIKELKMPASNLSRCADVTKGKMKGMKSHDCHIFMECLLPIAFRSLPAEIWKPLTELSCFFKDLCCNTLKLEDLVRMEQNIPIIICKLERIFPPGFFDSMEHIPIHLPNEAILGGPVQYRWMYPFERLMGDSKRSVKNKARVEGSICTSYLHRETTYFCSHYFKTFNLLPSTSLRNNPQLDHENVQPKLSILSKCGRPSGKPQVYWLLDKEWKSAHVHVLINCDEVKPYLEVFLQHHSIDEQNACLIHDEFPNWLKAYMQDERNGTINPYVKALSQGPCLEATSWHMYFVNGYKFHTQDWSHGKKTTNCGVHVKGLTNGGEDDYYGIIQNILQLEYDDFDDKITLFHCEWFDPTKNSGTRQVYYVPYPPMCRDLRGWCAAITTKPRGHVEMDNFDDEMPYQSNEMSPIVPITEVEQIRGRGRETHGKKSINKNCLQKAGCGTQGKPQISKNLQKAPSAVQKAPTVQKTPSAVQKAPSAVQKAPSAIQKAASTVQKAPSPVQAAPPVKAATSVQVPPSQVTTPAHTQPPIQTTAPEAFRFVPTPGFTLPHQLQQGPPQFTTHEMEIDHHQQQEEVERDNEEDVEGDNEEDEKDDNHDNDAGGKVVIRPVGTGFAPSDVAAAAIRRVIEKKFPNNITCYSDIKTPEEKATWFKRFQKLVTWEPRHEEEIKKRFHQACAKRLTDILTKARTKMKKPKWMENEGWTYLTNSWQQEDFKLHSQRNKINRASSKGGALHTTGRKAHHDIALDMATKLRRPVHPDELFVVTHKKKNGDWVDRRSERTHFAVVFDVLSMLKRINTLELMFFSDVVPNVEAFVLSAMKV